METITEKKSRAGDWPDFVTAEDLAQGEKIVRELKRLLRHKERLNAQAVKKVFEQAADAYVKAPTDENFEVLRASAAEFAIFQGPPTHYVTHVRGFVHQVIGDHVLRRSFVTWGRAIVERGLETARANLAEVIRCEKEHHLKLTGESLGTLGTQSNPIIDKARVPVRELENMIAVTNSAAIGTAATDAPNVSKFLEFLRARFRAQNKKGAS